MIDFLKNNKYIIISSLISLAIGIIVFCLYYDISLVNPFYEKWIFNSEIADLRQFHTGWQYFRFAPWTFPLGTYNTLSYPINTSILNTLQFLFWQFRLN